MRSAGRAGSRSTGARRGADGSLGYVDADGKLVVRSPCCDQPARLPDWLVAYARQATGGRARVQCGRAQTDPLRAVDPARGNGCGGWYEVDLTERGT